MNLPAEDLLAIQSLVARYCLTTDDADPADFMGCWVAPDEFGGYESGPFGSMATWDELYEFEKEHTGPGGMALGKRHQVTNLRIEAVSATEARVTHDLQVLEGSDPPRLIATGRYDDSVVVKTDGAATLRSEFDGQEVLEADASAPGFSAPLEEAVVRTGRLDHVRWSSRRESWAPS